MKINALYCPLPKHITCNLTTLGLEELDYSATTTINTFFNELFKSRIHETSSFKKNLHCKPLMMDVLPSKNTKKPKKKRKTLTSRERKRLGLFDIKKTNQLYETYIPLHELWKEYIKQLLQLKNYMIMKQIEMKLLKADYHGCILTVTSSKCSSYVDLSGIVLKETKNTFTIITKKDTIKAIPKKNSVFTFELEDFIFRIIGDNFCFRSADRVSRKFKPKHCPDFNWLIGEEI